MTTDRPPPATDQPPSPDYWQIQTTAASREEAERLAQELIARRQAACVQIGGPIRSVYRWAGTVESSEEWTMTIKTTAARYADVAATIKELHTYQTPELIALPILAGSADYLAWLQTETN